MSYVQENLMPNETLLYTAGVHWIVYVQGIACTAVGVALGICVPLVTPKGASAGTGMLIPLMLVMVGVISFLKALIYVKTTEFAVTNMRVVAKTGWLSHKVTELRHEKIEGLSMEQSMYGRMFNYGTLVLSGTGGDKTYIELITHPSAFCNQAMQLIHRS